MVFTMLAIGIGERHLGLTALAVGIYETQDPGFTALGTGIWDKNNIGFTRLAIGITETKALVLQVWP